MSRPPIIDLDAARRAAMGIVEKPEKQKAALVVTHRQNNLHEAPPRTVDGVEYQQVFQISPSMALFEDQTKAIWAPVFSEANDGTIQFFTDKPPWVYGVGFVIVKGAPSESPARTEIPIRAEATIYRLYPTPGTVIHTVPLQAWMTIHSGNLKAFENYLNEHPKPEYQQHDLNRRLEAIFGAMMEFNAQEGSGEAGSNGEGEGSPSTSKSADTAPEDSSEDSGPDSSSTD